MKAILKMQELSSQWMRLFLALSALPLFFSTSHAEIPTFGSDGALSCSVRSADTLTYARVIVYRPDNQLRRKYKINTNHGGYCELKRNQMVEINATSNTFSIEVNASGHKKEQFTFELKRDAVHHFRIQDRNNYNGFLPFLEVIEVSEATFRGESPEKPN